MIKWLLHLIFVVPKMHCLFVFFKARLLHWVNNDIRYIDAHTEDKKSVFLLLNLIKRIVKSQAKATCGPWGCKIKTFPLSKTFFSKPSLMNNFPRIFFIGQINSPVSCRM